MDPSIEEYIRQNRHRYTREAIREQLIAAGHDPSAIDQALRAESASRPADASRAGEQLQTGWAILLYLAGFSIPVWLFLSALLDGSFAPSWPILMFVFIVLYAVVGFFVVRSVTRWGPPSNVIDWIRFMVALPFLFAVLLGVGFFTTCLAAYRFS